MIIGNSIIYELLSETLQPIKLQYSINMRIANIQRYIRQMAPNIQYKKYKFSSEKITKKSQNMSSSLNRIFDWWCRLRRTYLENHKALTKMLYMWLAEGNTPTPTPPSWACIGETKHQESSAGLYTSTVLRFVSPLYPETL